MGIQVEFNPDLALRSMKEFHAGRRQQEECIPDPIISGHEYPFSKLGQRNYWLDGELPLVETNGNQSFSRPRASIMILEATHVKIDGEVWTRGMYRVVEVYDQDAQIHFEGFTKI
jgi:hypothetical protein